MKGELGDLTIQRRRGQGGQNADRDRPRCGHDQPKRWNESINQIAFSGAEEFMEKSKNQWIIGHFGLGFYSSFMVARGQGRDLHQILVEERGQDRALENCTGTPEFEMEETDAEHGRGTTIVLRLSEDPLESRQSSKVEEDARARYCPVPARAHRFRQGQGVEGRQVRQIPTRTTSSTTSIRFGRANPPTSPRSSPRSSIIRAIPLWSAARHRSTTTDDVPIRST